MAQIFVAFSEKLNFNAKHLPYVLQQASCRQPYEPYSCNRLKKINATKKLTSKIKKLTHRIMKSIKRTNLTIVSQTLRLLTCSIKVSLGGRVDLLLERDELESEPTAQYVY